jgi:hypothetical protein
VGLRDLLTRHRRALDPAESWELVFSERETRWNRRSWS